MFSSVSTFPSVFIFRGLEARATKVGLAPSTPEQLTYSSYCRLTADGQVTV